MTRLTLHWHLRTIVNGNANASEEDGLSSEEYAELHAWEADHYDELMAQDALNADDSVAYLDAVTRDPARRFQERYDAAELLGLHILERRLLNLTSWPSVRSLDDPVRSDFLDAEDLPTKSKNSGHWSMVECPNCLEGEVLYDWDEETPQCHCGTQIPLPTYPDGSTAG